MNKMVNQNTWDKFQQHTQNPQIIDDADNRSAYIDYRSNIILQGANPVMIINNKNGDYTEIFINI